MRICSQGVVEGSWLSCEGKGSAWVHRGKQADVKPLEGMIALPHMRSGLLEAADGIPNLTSPDAIGLGARKNKNQRILLDLLLDTVKSNNLSMIRFSIYLHPPPPIDCLWCDNSCRLSWHILLPANRGAPLSQWGVSVLSKCTMLNPVS